MPETETLSSDAKPASLARRVFTRTDVQLVAAFLLIFGLMLKIQFAGPAILDNDGYYHIRWSKMLRQSAPRLPEFSWLPLTVLDKSSYADHHFLFHVLLMPFTFGDLRIGAKLAAALYSSVGLTGVFALLVLYRVQYRWLWLIPLVAGSEPFLFRMSMTRAPSLSIFLLGIGCYLILERKLVWLGVVGFIFVWLYSLFPLLLAFALVHTVCLYIVSRRISFAAPLASLAGIAAGLILNPYFPRDLILMFEHLSMKLKSNFPVQVGMEWYAYDTWSLVTRCAVIVVLYFAALLAFDFKRCRDDIKPLFFLGVSALLLLIFFKSMRFVEYWAPFAAIFVAFSLTPVITKVLDIRIKVKRDRIIGAITAAVLTIAFSLSITFNAIQAGHDMAAEPSPYAYRGAADYLVKNTPEGSIVFNVDWDAFPMLFYYDTHNKYVAGLDPSYLHRRSYELSSLYDDIANGNDDDAGKEIKGAFGAEFVVAATGDSDFLQTAADSKEFETVYKDQYAVVLRVKPKPAPSPDSNNDDDNDDSE